MGAQSRSCSALIDKRLEIEWCRFHSATISCCPPRLSEMIPVTSGRELSGRRKYIPMLGIAALIDSGKPAAVTSTRTIFDPKSANFFISSSATIAYRSVSLMLDNGSYENGRSTRREPYTRESIICDRQIPARAAARSTEAGCLFAARDQGSSIPAAGRLMPQSRRQMIHLGGAEALRDQPSIALRFGLGIESPSRAGVDLHAVAR